MVKSISIFIILLIFFSCKNLNSEKSKGVKLKMLYVHETPTELGTGFEHYILIEKFSRSDLDSARMLKAAIDYRDTVGKYKYPVAMPANILRFYNSDEGFSRNENMPDSLKVNKNCLVVIKFGYYNTPNSYIFYNRNGEIKYSGIYWLKNK